MNRNNRSTINEIQKKTEKMRNTKRFRKKILKGKTKPDKNSLMSACLRKKILQKSKGKL